MQAGGTKWSERALWPEALASGRLETGVRAWGTAEGRGNGRLAMHLLGSEPLADGRLLLLLLAPPLRPQHLQLAEARPPTPPSRPERPASSRSRQTLAPSSSQPGPPPSAACSPSRASVWPRCPCAPARPSFAASELGTPVKPTRVRGRFHWDPRNLSLCRSQGREGAEGEKRGGRGLS